MCCCWVWFDEGEKVMGDAGDPVLVWCVGFELVVMMVVGAIEIA